METLNCLSKLQKKNPACETFSPDQMYRIDPHLKMKLFEKTPVKKIENGDEVETTMLSFEDNLAEMEQKHLMRDEVTSDKREILCSN